MKNILLSILLTIICGIITIAIISGNLPIIIILGIIAVVNLICLQIEEFF